MDLSNLQTWKDGARVVFIDAPHIVWPLLAAAVTATWWFRGRQEQAEKNGLKVAHAAHVALEERMKLKDDMIKLKDEQISHLEKKFAELEGPLKAQAHIAPKQSKPELKLFMTSANIFIVNDEPAKGHSGIFLYASVVNTGGPTIAAEWTLSIMPQADLPVALRPRAIADEVRLSGHAIVIRGADSLIEKAKNKQLAIEPIEGWLFFVTEMPKATVIDKKTRFELSMRDVYGNEAKVARLIEEF